MPKINQVTIWCWKRCMNDEDTLRAEYTAELIKSGVRGKYASRYREGTNIVLVEPELHRLFPDSEAVNRAFRQFVKEHQASDTTQLTHCK